MDESLLDVLRCPRTGQPLRLETWETADQHVLSGRLVSDAGEYPIVDGIPILRLDSVDVWAPLRAGRPDLAAARAAFDGVPRRRLERFLPALQETRLTGRAATALAARLAAVDEERGAAVLRESPKDAAAQAATRHAYLRCLHPSRDAFNYFTYRLGTPRHLVGLAVAEHVLARQTGPVLDLGCGAGQLTSFLSRSSDAATVGLDVSYLLLWIARSHLPRKTQLVCADARFLPFRAAAFGTVFSSDVLSYVAEKRATVREAGRVLLDGGALALTSVRNAHHEHVFGGEALPPPAWRELVTPWSHSLLDDDKVLGDYLRGNGLAATFDAQAAEVESQTLSVLAQRPSRDRRALSDSDLLSDGGRLSTWPHSRGPLQVHPLYRPLPQPDGAVQFTLGFPSDTYVRDNPLMTYLPAQFQLSGTDLPQLRSQRSTVVRELVARVAILAVPGADEDGREGAVEVDDRPIEHLPESSAWDGARL